MLSPKLIIQVVLTKRKKTTSSEHLISVSSSSLGSRFPRSGDSVTTYGERNNFL
ncbi:Bgt-20991 [Blumeria graminis f. sp. tritici]|uniref:Bgt-20991 n=2 Tax=Blumeria graminis f. sp. tritici TaxID=62690 RepID=A0A381L741_BLUGR|nr:Bgt-20991 [Blumeria graminis f. sp. tritici]